MYARKSHKTPRKARSGLGHCESVDGETTTDSNFTVESATRESRRARKSPNSTSDHGDDFDRKPYQRGRLWTGDDISAPKPRPYTRADVARYRTKDRRPCLLFRPAAPPPDDDPTEMIKEPETSPISQEQLVAEVKGIYAGLVMVESKCIAVDNTQSAQPAQTGLETAGKLNNDQWQVLTALHRTLLYEHHDFFLASQHPSASPAPRRLAAKYAMPARMRCHGIHSFLELKRHRLPANLDYMLTFIYMAHSMMALLYETVPDSENTWIECLGDLGRYRMAIEDDDIRDREVWTAVSRHWYARASDKASTTGRLYHHLAILARPNALQQLYYYAKSLFVDMPFPSARESVVTLFDLLWGSQSPQQTNPSVLMMRKFVKNPRMLFGSKRHDTSEKTLSDFLQLLDDRIRRSTRRRLEPEFGISFAALACILSGANCKPSHSATIDDTGSPHDQTMTKGEPQSRLPHRRLPEDYELRGLILSPFPCLTSGEDEIRETPQMGARRRERAFTQTADTSFSTLMALGIVPKCPTWTSAQSNVTSAVRVTRQRLRRALRAFFPLFIAGFVAANPPIPCRMPKILTVGTSGMISFSTSMISMQFEDPADPIAAPHLKAALRSISVGFSAVLFMSYALFFLRGRGTHQKKRAFLYGFGLCSAVLWLFVRLSAASASATPQHEDVFQWLDTATLHSLVAVFAGILNAESNLFSALLSQGQSQGYAGDIAEQLDALHAAEDEENSAAVVPVSGATDVSNNAARRGGNGLSGLAPILNALANSNGFSLPGANS